MDTATRAYLASVARTNREAVLALKADSETTLALLEIADEFSHQLRDMYELRAQQAHQIAATNGKAKASATPTP